MGGIQGGDEGTMAFLEKFSEKKERKESLLIILSLIDTHGEKKCINNNSTDGTKTK